MLRGPQTPQRDDTERKTAAKRPNARPTEATAAQRSFDSAALSVSSARARHSS